MPRARAPRRREVFETRAHHCCRSTGSPPTAFYSGKHKRHGVNVQVIADPHGKLLWASPALPGAVHDIS